MAGVEDRQAFPFQEKGNEDPRGDGPAEGQYLPNREIGDKPFSDRVHDAEGRDRQHHEGDARPHQASLFRNVRHVPSLETFAKPLI